MSTEQPATSSPSSAISLIERAGHLPTVLLMLSFVLVMDIGVSLRYGNTLLSLNLAGFQQYITVGDVLIFVVIFGLFMSVCVKFFKILADMLVLFAVRPYWQRNQRGQHHNNVLKTRMKISISSLFLLLLAALPLTAPAAEPEVVYWNTDAGKALRARIAPDADYWQLIPWFTNQIDQSYCGVASAVTVLNAMPIKKPVDPIYAPHAYFTQNNFFTPEVVKVISPQTVRNLGMTRNEMVETLTQLGVKATTVAGDSVDESSLRALVQKALGDDGRYVLVNFLRESLGQTGGGHWSVLAAYDAQSDRALILDVSKYMYEPEWVTIKTLRKAIDTMDFTSFKKRGLVFVSQ